VENKKLLVIPLIPAIRPLPIKKIITASPINNPPNNELMGVKLIIVIYLKDILVSV
jgi:hypothetical protein